MMGLATLGGIPFDVDPDSVKWSFDMKVAEKITLGGKVIQVFGTQLGDMTVAGKFGRPDTKRGENATWEVQERFVSRVRGWVTTDVKAARTQPLRFLYPTKKWDFKVYVKALSSDAGSLEHVSDNPNPGWQLTLFIAEDSAGVIVKGIKDAYIARLVNGVGWKQTEYNGPMDKPAELGTNTVGDYLKQKIFYPSGATTSTGTPNPGGNLTPPPGTSHQSTP